MVLNKRDLFYLFCFINIVFNMTWSICLKYFSSWFWFILYVMDINQIYLFSFANLDSKVACLAFRMIVIVYLPNLTPHSTESSNFDLKDFDINIML